MDNKISRREMLAALPAMAVAARSYAQTPASIAVTGINHVTLAVSDLKRSTDFYQGLFGMPIVSRAPNGANLGIGAGPQFLGLSSAGAAAPNINHICFGVENFSADRVTAALAAHGLMATNRGNAGQLFFTDPDGILVQLQDSKYCGGTGPLGAVCRAVEPSPKKGLMALKGWSHCTIFTSDGARSNMFYADLFGLKVQAYQGPAAPLYAVGGKGEFIMFAGGGGRGRAGAPPRPASINHLCMNMDNFDPDRVIKALESYGLKPRGETRAPGPTPPLVHYISLRMENRGGAKEGTPELYFTDPDGLLIQLQDTKYCGGAGTLGEICRA